LKTIDGEGIKIRSDNNRVTGNMVSGTVGDCLKVDKGDCDDPEEPFTPFVGGRNNVFTGNACSFSGEDGWEIEGVDNKFIGNTAFNNAEKGFKVEDTATGNIFKGNNAQNNGEEDFFDENGDCGSNTYGGNSGGTADPACMIV